MEDILKILGNIGIILDRTRHSGNIGSAGRLMKNLGFTRLHLVNPTEYMHISAIRMAHGTEEMIESADIHESITDAISSYHLTFATSHRMKQETALSLVEGARRIVSTAKTNRVAILFGSEKYGLSRDETDKANGVIRLPVEPEFPSVNLAQSVCMVALQIKIEAMAQAGETAREGVGDTIHLPKEKSGMFIEEFLSVAEAIGFEMPSIELKMRDVFERANMTESEFNLFYGLIRMLNKRISGRVDGRKY